MRRPTRTKLYPDTKLFLSGPRRARRRGARTLEPLEAAPALPVGDRLVEGVELRLCRAREVLHHGAAERRAGRSEEHTSELQSRQYLVCRLLLEKKIIRR